MEDERRLYRLDGVAHVAGTIEEEATEYAVRIYARAYIMMLLSTQLFMDKSANRVHLRWLLFVARLDDIGSYSWGAAALAWLYRCMCRVANRNVTNLAGPLQLLQSWIFWRFPTLRPPGFDAFSFPLASRYSLIYSFFQVHYVLYLKLHTYVLFLQLRWATYLPSSDGKERRIIQYRLALDRLTHRDIVWEPYGSLDVLAVIHPEILTEEHSRLWRAVTSLIYFAVNEWHQVDRVFPQLGGVQHLPEPALNIEYLHRSSRRYPTDTHVGGTAEASMGGTSFTHVSSSQILHGCSTQLLADLATTSFTMDLDDQLGVPHFYVDFAKIIRGDDVHQYQSPIPGGPSDPTEYRPHPADMPETQVPETRLPVDLNEPAGSPYDTWFGMGGRHHLHLELGHRRLRWEIGERLGLGVRLDVA
ncbi:hypothetical protein Ahy_B10g106189 [Arachis hypogaea]|uniref:Aminotransferase-like plant mobile domain-containing protein n=1 Tax=Arachis hypogaea TaxID=3818 RepID=A0A444XA38_ARAHY|nr:hypothetical protein Ahy_B10g106189 [Arachis hypogaea]